MIPPVIVSRAWRGAGARPRRGLGTFIGRRRPRGRGDRSEGHQGRASGKVEIERTFLVDTRRWAPSDGGTRIRQGYLASVNGCSVRVRIAGSLGFPTVKGPIIDLTRSEFEYAIPLDDARFMLHRLCPQPIIDKTRYREVVGATSWGVDAGVKAVRTEPVRIVAPAQAMGMIGRAAI